MRDGPFQRSDRRAGPDDRRRRQRDEGRTVTYSARRTGDLPHPLADAGVSVAAHLGGPGELTLASALPRLLSLAEQCFGRLIEIVMTVEEAWHV